MNWKEKLLSSCNLYLILDAGVHSYIELLDIAKEALSGGVDIIQLRAKNAEDKDVLEFSAELKKLTDKKVPYIINDRLDLALMAEADGVHLGQDDLSIIQARQLLKPNMIIGTSCQSLDHIRQAQKDGVDYIGFGSVFKTLTKPERDPMDLAVLKQALMACSMPLFAIGGINLDNVDQLCSLGIKRIAVCRAISQAQDIKKASQSFKNKLKEKSSVYA